MNARIVLKSKIIIYHEVLLADYSFDDFLKALLSGHCPPWEIEIVEMAIDDGVSQLLHNFFHLCRRFVFPVK